MTDTDIPAPVAEAIDVAREAARAVVEHEPQEGWNTLGDPDLGEGGSREWSVPDACTQAVLKVLMPEVRRLTAELADWQHNLALRAFTAPDADLDTVLESLNARIRDALAKGEDRAEAAVAAARRDERERCADAVGEFVSAAQESGQDAKARSYAFIQSRIRALPDAAPVCGADVDGHPCVRPADHHDIGPCNNRWPSGVPEEAPCPVCGLAPRDQEYGPTGACRHTRATRTGLPRTTTEET